MAKTGPKPRPYTERVWLRVVRSTPDACWEWSGALLPNGYGVLGKGGKYGGNFYAHRAAYESAHGPIPSGAVVMHLCNNKPCCNPAHLRVGTCLENSQMAVKDGLIPRGSARSSAKLSELTVAEARSAYAAGVENQYELAERYGVSVMAINLAVRRKTWAHVP